MRRRIFEKVIESILENLGNFQSILLHLWKPKSVELTQMWNGRVHDQHAMKGRNLCVYDIE